ncbi:MAG: 16S rRNA (guanine(527)-N(7))-methyltransferase [Bacteroidetes bacterium GWF2_40_14]|nr:MAG: 16S rRNA (guanine(527)-N(7))-methyltransferase [Bacteroidetes bacterium GWF2_40_14]
MEELIYSYFPELSANQKNQIAQLYPLYLDWNSKINVISRKDIDNLYLHHVLHSLAIARFIKLPDGAKVLDVGTGGGFPGIPLAIFFPEVSFFLCDSIMKKIKVVKEISASLNLKNVQAEQIRAEDIKGKFDFVVSRAVTDINTFLPWIWNRLEKGETGGVGRGLLYLKGGNLIEEISEIQKRFNIPAGKISKIEIQRWFKEPFFDEKSILYIKR